MKNLHILPTDKPSRLVKIKDNLFYTTTENIPGGVYQNIYITSDEEAKEGDWGYIPFQGGDVKLVGKYFADDWKKIILTTDQELIEDGVQAIDDEFLEWFVKNPSCEEVEVKDVFKSSPIGFGNTFDYYKIIIPSEENSIEAKQRAKNYMRLKGALEPKTKKYSDEEVLELLQKALTHKDNGETGNLITAQGEIRTANFYSWFEQNKKK